MMFNHSPCRSVPRHVYIIFMVRETQTKRRRGQSRPVQVSKLFINNLSHGHYTVRNKTVTPKSSLIWLFLGTGVPRMKVYVTNSLNSFVVLVDLQNNLWVKLSHLDLPRVLTRKGRPGVYYYDRTGLSMVGWLCDWVTEEYYWILSHELIGAKRLFLWLLFASLKQEGYDSPDFFYQSTRLWQMDVVTLILLVYSTRKQNDWFRTGHRFRTPKKNK